MTWRLQLQATWLHLFNHYTSQNLSFQSLVYRYYCMSLQVHLHQECISRTKDVIKTWGTESSQSLQRGYVMVLHYAHYIHTYLLDLSGNHVHQTNKFLMQKDILAVHKQNNDMCQSTYLPSWKTDDNKNRSGHQSVMQLD